MQLALCLGLFSPLVGFLFLCAFIGKINRTYAGWLACLTVMISFSTFLGILINDLMHGSLPQSITLFRWIPIKGIEADWTLYIDSLSLLMTLIITGVGSLIHIYSIGYMDHEEDFSRFFACMNFFVFAMLLLVLAGHLLVLFVGWEGVGLASYLLIGFWYQRPSAAQASTKAFVMNRIGDLGLLVGLLLTFHLFGTGNIVEISSMVSQKFTVGAPIITLLTLLYFVGAVGKSAQLPLHTWLPDAMEGPTPVSALIHAATMVTAGVYLVVRMHPVFSMTPETLLVIGTIGGVTSLFAAFCALAQTDLKRVLAYSTVSQLGLMFLACGAGAYYAAMFHLTMHAFVKALLFLSAGNVVHMMHGETEMEKMGGLRKIFPVTRWLFLIGILALSGVPPLAAFFSKELILSQEYHAGFKVLYGIGMAASLLTAFYMTRAYCLTFANELNDSSHLQGVKEAPKVMLRPLSILALLSIVGGFIGYGFGGIPLLEKFLAASDVTMQANTVEENLFLDPLTWLAVFGSLIGIFSALFLYLRMVHRLGKPIQFLKRGFYINELYHLIFVLPLRMLSKFIVNILEPGFFEGIIVEFSKAVDLTARGFQKFQNGLLRSYIAWTVVGCVVLIVYFVI